VVWDYHQRACYGLVRTATDKSFSDSDSSSSSSSDSDKGSSSSREGQPAPLEGAGPARCFHCRRPTSLHDPRCPEAPHLKEVVGA
jgi:hypothetical protein